MSKIKDFIMAFKGEKDLSNAEDIFKKLELKKYSRKQNQDFKNFLDFISSSEWNDWIEINECDFQPLVRVWYRRRHHELLERLHMKIALIKAIKDKFKKIEETSPSFEITTYGPFENSKEYIHKYEVEVYTNGISFCHDGDDRWYDSDFYKTDIDFLREILYSLYSLKEKERA